ncbi:LOB domain-containing protein 36-like [Macadamia integrifolia]|uniref:LOB domain-containing protein 36-like n=1 Tax=Macadamia integrifolia TaxID=60698 RepID=UPI001C4F3F13|nr:LOB domain-containing protein 36-like [Macadamia integrifolia]
MASSSNSPCAACKFLRQKCTQECVLAPYFPPDQPTKFANVHKVFGKSNVAKILNDLNPTQREDAVNSLAYEADARLRDPVYGCVGLISILQQELRQIQFDLNNAKKELVNYMGPSGMLPFSHHHPHHQFLYPQLQQNLSSNMGPYGISPVGMGMPLLAQAQAQAQAQVQLLMRERQQQQQQMLEAQHLAAVVATREQHEMMGSYTQQQQQELVRFNGGFDGTAGSGGGDGVELSQLSIGLPSSLALVPLDNFFQIQQPQQEHPHQHQQQQNPHPQQRALSDEFKSVHPSS